MTCWTTTGRCPNPADTIMFAPDGKRVPGFVCKHHAEAAIAEYREKLGEQWTCQPATQPSSEPYQRIAGAALKAGRS